MNRRELLVGSLACAGASLATAGLGAVAITEALPVAGPINTCVTLYTGMRVHSLDVVPVIVGNSRYLSHLVADVVMRNDAGLEMKFSTTNTEHIEELQMGVTVGATYTYEVTQEIPHDVGNGPAASSLDG